jgi:hypothetical protein
MLYPIINSIQWCELEHAYGSASDAPRYLNNLCSSDENEIDEAVDHFLLSSACHQYTTYSCTPWVVRCVIKILNLSYFEIEQTSGIFDFLRACTHSARNKTDLKKEILNGVECYKKYADHRDVNVVKNVKLLLEFCAEVNEN